MKTKLSLFIAFSLFCPTLALALDVPEPLQPDVAKAMTDGGILYKAYLKGPVKSDSIEKEKKKIDDFCEFQYNAYLANDSIYLIAEPPAAGGIVFGRHYRISGDKITRSTITCFASPEQPKNAVGAFTTHHLSDAPSEFHVFISLKFKKPIYVRSRTGIWKVEEGRIAFLEKRE
ncbi:MAG TPA: hypothetical protein VEM15_13910 [Thermodesulfobacteriota bacterium]|nr:hypothetical protein [Thermodesulfobacteriota bacterium]